MIAPIVGCYKSPNFATKMYAADAETQLHSVINSTCGTPVPHFGIEIRSKVLTSVVYETIISIGITWQIFRQCRHQRTQKDWNKWSMSCLDYTAADDKYSFSSSECSMYLWAGAYIMEVRGPDPLKICRRGQSMFWPPKMSHFFIQNCCWITLQVPHHAGWKICANNRR